MRSSHEKESVFICNFSVFHILVHVVFKTSIRFLFRTARNLGISLFITIYNSSCCLYFEENSILDVWLNPESASEFNQCGLTKLCTYFSFY